MVDPAHPSSPPLQKSTVNSRTTASRKLCCQPLDKSRSTMLCHYLHHGKADAKNTYSSPFWRSLRVAAQGERKVSCPSGALVLLSQRRRRRGGYLFLLASAELQNALIIFACRQTINFPNSSAPRSGTHSRGAGVR